MDTLPAMPVAWWIPRLIVAFVIFLLLLSLRPRREAIRHWVRRIVIVEATYFAVVYLMVHIGRPPIESLLEGILAGFVVNQMQPRRSRHIPASVRRRKIAEYELRTGKKFNPRKHELDHGIPFSRGGSHTADNLSVMEKRRNRSKGAKSPWWDLFG
jgi:hypothetical protein